MIFVNCEEQCLDFLESQAIKKQQSFGIVIGQKCQDTVYVVHLAPYPSQEDTISSGNVCLQSLTDGNVAAYARQVVRMLPGGLDVVGIYLTMPQSDITKSTIQGKIKSILIAMHKNASKYFLQDEETIEKLVMFGCIQSLKIGVKSMNLSEHGSTLSNGNLQRKNTKWLEIDYNYSLTYPIYFPKDKMSQSLCKNVLVFLKPWTQSIDQALILINNSTVKGDTLLDPDYDKPPVKKKGTKGLDLHPPKVLNAMFLEREVSTQDCSEIQETSGSVTFSGTIAGRAFVHSKATAKEGICALKTDLVRSVVSRWEMHCDSLIEEPQGSISEPVLHEPPRRVFLEGGGLPVSLCDYLFPGDSSADACQSAAELLNITINPEHVDETTETVADASELLGSVADSLSSSSPVMHLDEVSSVSRSNAFHFVIAVFIGLVAVAISYLTITRSKPSS